MTLDLFRDVNKKKRHVFGVAKQLRWHIAKYFASLVANRQRWFDSREMNLWLKDKQNMRFEKYIKSSARQA